MQWSELATRCAARQSLTFYVLLKDDAVLPFTPRLRKAFAHAEALAESRRQDVSALDLLHGILSLGDGVAVAVLKARGIADGGSHPTSSAATTDVESPSAYAPCALRALSGAMTEAVSFAHSFVGVEHTLVGILTVPSDDVSRLFAQKGIRVEEVLSDVRSQM